MLVQPMPSPRSFAVLVVLLGACRTHGPLPVASDATLAAPDSATPDVTAPMSDVLPPPTGPETGVAPEPDAALTLDEQCALRNMGAVPPPAVPCSAAPIACASQSISCRGTGLANTLRSQLKACGTPCGEIDIAFSSGCASDVRFSPTVNTLEKPEVQACIRQLVLGKAWTCAPTEAWAHVYIDSCTLP